MKFNKGIYKNYDIMDYLKLFPYKFSLNYYELLIFSIIFPI